MSKKTSNKKKESPEMFVKIIAISSLLVAILLFGLSQTDVLTLATEQNNCGTKLENQLIAGFEERLRKLELELNSVEFDISTYQTTLYTSLMLCRSLTSADCDKANKVIRARKQLEEAKTRKQVMINEITMINQRLLLLQAQPDEECEEKEEEENNDEEEEEEIVEISDEQKHLNEVATKIDDLAKLLRICNNPYITGILEDIATLLASGNKEEALEKLYALKSEYRWGSREWRQVNFWILSIERDYEEQLYPFIN